MRRSVFALFLAAVVLTGVGAAACGSPASAPTSTTAAASSGNSKEWLAAQAGRWNTALNHDQNSVDSAAATTTGLSSAAYFSRLEDACTKMRDDARSSTRVPEAPTATLQEAWSGMLAATETYANRCLEVAHSQSNSAVSDWKSSLQSMN